MENNFLCRTGLYASGANVANMIQSVFYEQDVLIYDLEDSVPLDEKDAARFLIYSVVKKHRPQNKHVQIRTNGIHSLFFQEDLEAAVRAKPDALRIPKVETAEEVHNIAEKIATIEHAAGIEEGTIKLWCTIESHIGLLNAQEIAKASPRVQALILGAEDFTASMQAKRTKEGWEIFYARNMVLLACRTANIKAIDALFADIEDAEGLAKDCAMTKNLGFDGKTVIHPRQIHTVNGLFTPSKKEISHALRVVEAIEEGKRLKKGAVTVDGSMIDAPIVLRAHYVLTLAKATGAISQEELEEIGFFAEEGAQHGHK